ncbi:hypothetical protein E1A91_D11G370100v1 [Gossypium mustelinum]|uniref:Uncharacterized protein n=1 Tax=Gossypium mustelinum TaxID=34275 RepID=A0A5D2T1F7_GOSMU|nr:hypothetical protein E1A91_D11G370100v1 [Gossypium mustelinum]
MSSMEKGGLAVGVPGGAVSTDQTITKNTTTNNPQETIIPMPGTELTLSNGELENFRSLDEAFDGNQLDPKAKPLIRRVPSTLGRHEDFRKYFKPKVISIGPLHHADPSLHESKKLKCKLTTLFVKNIGVDRGTLYNNIKTEIDDLKKCYDPKELDNYTSDNENLAWMFFVDGCTILQAVYMRYGNDDVDGQDYESNDDKKFMEATAGFTNNTVKKPESHQQDSSRKNGEKFMMAIKRFIDDTVITPAYVKELQSHQQDSDWWQQQKGERIHLLNLLRVRLLFEKEKKEKPWRHFRFCTRFFMCTLNRSSQTRTKPHHSHTFRNVKELKKAGIWLKASKTSCLSDISFNHIFFVGKLRLPPITFDDSTMNLIAYEMCPDFKNDFTVTSYMDFLDSLIHEAEDVKELRGAGILYNRLGGDEEVAKLIKKMNTDVVRSQTTYSEVKQQIYNHCKNMWIQYPAQAYHTCFRTRWTFFAFVGAIAALFVSSLQTHYTIHQPK